MSFKPETKDYKDKRTEWLHRKWGMEDSNANASLEQTRKMILEMLWPRWGDLKNDKSKFCTCQACQEHRQTQKKYFEDVLKHQEKWDKIWAEEYSGR